jgi:hypothetical protein
MTRVTVEQVEAASAAAPNIEQAADLAALQAMAGDEPPAPGTPGAPDGLPVVDLATEISQGIAIAVAILSPMLPSLRDVYTDATTGAAGAAIAAVCNKHGWLQGGVLGRWGEEIACLAVVGPLAVATYKGVTGDLAELRRKAAEKKAAGGQPAAVAAPVPVPGSLQQPGSNTVSFGAPAA